MVLKKQSGNVGTKQSGKGAAWKLVQWSGLGRKVYDLPASETGLCQSDEANAKGMINSQGEKKSPTHAAIPEDKRQPRVQLFNLFSLLWLSYTPPRVRADFVGPDPQFHTDLWLW